MTKDIKIDREFSKFVPPLSQDEYKLLESNIKADGCRDPLIVWEEENILIDGHNRFRICTENNLPFQIEKKSFQDREAVLDWLDCNELDRRNLEAAEDKENRDLYDVIVIDLPRFLQKRGFNQSGQDYVAMKEAELTIPFSKNCHIWIWNTHKLLPVGFQLLEKWGMQYECTFVWHEPVAINPIEKPQLNCEFAIYAKKGLPEFKDALFFPVCFSFPWEICDDDEKPAEFFKMIRRLTLGRRLTMFHTQKFDGFESKDVA